jgi:hypothetical protein
MVEGCELDSAALKKSTVARCCADGNEYSSAIRDGEFFDYIIFHRRIQLHGISYWGNFNLIQLPSFL